MPRKTSVSRKNKSVPSWPGCMHCSRGAGDAPLGAWQIRVLLVETVTTHPTALAEYSGSKSYSRFLAALPAVHAALLPQLSTLRAPSLDPAAGLHCHSVWGCPAGSTRSLQSFRGCSLTRQVLHGRRWCACCTSPPAPSPAAVPGSPSCSCSWIALPFGVEVPLGCCKLAAKLQGQRQYM